VPSERDEAIRAVCTVYHQAPARAEAGARTISIDEMTGVQALQRKHSGLPLAPGKVAAREFEYIRHGTRAFILNFDVVSGQVVAPSMGPTRTEADFLAHVQQLVATDPEARKWHLVLDNLNIHKSVSLVRYVAELSEVSQELGAAGVRGVLQSMPSRAAFLSNPEHKIVFHYTPKHASWLNQIEIWLSVLVRKVIRRGNFSSVADLEEKVRAFIAYYNRSMAKPYRWTYTGRALAA
jgi:transposase